MNFLDLNKLIKENRLGGAYLFKGSEAYLMEKYIIRIRDHYIEENFRMINYIELDTTTNFDQILNACETLPFASDKKLVLVKDIGQVLQSDKGLAEKLRDYIFEIDLDNILILWDREDLIKKNTSLYKLSVKENRMVDFNRLNKGQLENFIGNIISQADKTILKQDLAYLIDRLGYLAYRSEQNLYQVENQLLKLLASTREQEVTRPSIDQAIDLDSNVSIFKLIDAIMDGNSRAALLELNQLYSAAEPVSRILYMLIRHFRLLAKYMAYAQAGYGPGDINQKLKISQFELGKLSRLSGKFRASQVEEILRSLLDFDVRQKSQSFDQILAMEILLLNMEKILYG